MKSPLRVIIIAGLISTILLTFFSILQICESKILLLDNKWLLVSGMPILIGLLVSGFVKSFKGFGIELETNLEEKIHIHLVGNIECLPLKELAKQSLQDLLNLSSTHKYKIERIQFVLGKKNYYDIYAVKEYFRELKNVKYIELINEQREFIGLLPFHYFIHQFSKDEEKSQPKVEELIRKIEDMSIINEKNIIEDKIKKGDSLLEAFKKFEKSNQGHISTNNGSAEQILPVVDSSNKMIGITRRTKLTERIAVKVLKSQK